jgi:hypothetical protein
MAIASDTALDRGDQRAPSLRRSPNATTIGVTVIALMLFVGAWLSALSDRIGWGASYPQQRSMYEVSRELALSTSPRTRLAAFNSGMLGFYSERDTVNLDGVVNRDALDAMRRHDLADYVRSQGIAYLIDYDSYVSGTFGGFWGQDEDVAVPASSHKEISSTRGDPYIIYSIAVRP